MDKTVAFCMRCFSNSAVPVSEKTNFCHYCGSEGTCIAIKKDEADYLREQIYHNIKVVNNL
jgi:rRNA maturation endonuclease Nob1